MSNPTTTPAGLPGTPAEMTTARHCGGCGWVHAAEDVHVLATPTSGYPAALVAAGRRSGHVGGYYQGAAGFVAVAVSRCCRDAREAAQALAPEGTRAATVWSVLRTEAEAAEAAAAEAYGERMYASAYGLGL